MLCGVGISVHIRVGGHLLGIYSYICTSACETECALIKDGQASVIRPLAVQAV